MTAEVPVVVNGKDGGLHSSPLPFAQNITRASKSAAESRFVVLLGILRFTSNDALRGLYSF